mgnify:CR=1 FL=1
MPFKAALIPDVGKTCDDDGAQASIIRRQPIIVEFRLVILDMINGMIQTISLFAEFRIKGQPVSKLIIGTFELFPIRMNQNIGFIGSNPDFGGVEVIDIQERSVCVGHYLDIGISMREIIEDNSAQSICEVKIGIVGIMNESFNRFIIRCQSFANDIIGFAVEDSPVNRRFAGKLIELCRQEVIFSKRDILFQVGFQVDEICFVEIEEGGVVVGGEGGHGGLLIC